MPSWKKVIVSGSDASLNSINVATNVVAQSFTGSLLGTSSYAVNADFLDGRDSTVFATTGSNIFRGNQTVTGSLFTSGSNTLIGNTILSGSVGISGSTTIDGTAIFRNSSTTITGSFLVSGSTTQIGNNTLAGNTTLSGSITISGSSTPGSPTASVQIYGDIRQAGYHRFDPVVTNINTAISASYIYVSGSTNDLYFSQNSAGYSNITRLRWLEGNLYTGLLHGGLITTQSSTVYQISSGSGIIVDLNASLSDDPYPTIQFLQWGNLSASIAPFTASYQQAFVGIDSTNNIYAQGTPFGNGQFSDIINVGNVLFQNQSTINGVKTQPSVAYGFEQQQNTFNRAFGPLKLSGYTLAPSGSSTGSLIVASGTAYAPGSNYTIDPNDPSYTIDPGTNVSKIFRYHQSGSTWVYNTNAGAGFATIDPTKYSNNGVLTNVGGGNWTIQRCFYFPNSVTKAIVVYYGNARYGTEAEARGNIDFESFVEAPNTSANAIYLGAIIINGTGVFTSPGDFTIYPGGLFRQVGGSGGGGSIVTQTLAGLSDVNISGPTDGQALVYNHTAAKWENKSSISASITGNAATATSASFAATASYTFNAVSASFATNALSSSFATNALSSSFAASATSASYAVSASHVIGGVNPFPYTGSAIISGSLAVTGSLAVSQNITGNASASFSLLAVNTTTPTQRVHLKSAVGVENGTTGGNTADQMIFGYAGSNLTQYTHKIQTGHDAQAALNRMDFLLANSSNTWKTPLQLRPDLATVSGSLVVTGSFAVITGSIVELQVTSTGVTIGNALTDIHNVTGSLGVTGSFTVTTTGTEFQVTSTGVNLGNIATDVHNVTGSLGVTGSLAVTGSVGFAANLLGASAWSAGGALITARCGLAGAGTQNEGLAFGGSPGPAASCTEEYNGSSWSTGGALITARRFLSGAGTQNAGLAFGGYSPPRSCTEEYNGSSWSAGGALSTARYGLAGAGTQNAGLAFGGYGGYSCTEEYDGSTWSTGGCLITARAALAGAGTQNAGLAFGGYISPSSLSCTEEYNGSSWSTGGALITARPRLAGAGTQNAGLAFGGIPGNPIVTSLSCTEEYNGTSWSVGGALITANNRLGGAGTQTAGLAFGGTPSIVTISCTEEYSQGIVTTKTFDYSSTTGNLTATGSFTGSFKGDGSGLTGVVSNPFPYTGSAVITGSLAVTGSVGFAANLLGASAWSAGGALSTARCSLAGAGTQNAGLAFGGTYFGAQSCTEEYNGTSWSSGGALITARFYLAGAGTQNAGLAFGGLDSGFTIVSCTEEYNGSTWTAGGALITARRQLAGTGTQNAGLTFGGYSYPLPVGDCTEEYDGTSWSTGGALSVGRYLLAGAGTQNAGLAFGGIGGYACTEEYNGTSWSAGGALITSRAALAGSGTQNAGLAFGGNIPTVSCTEEYNGTSWTAGGALIIARDNLAGAGIQTAGLAFGGFSPLGILSCTEEYSQGIVTTKTFDYSSTTGVTTVSCLIETSAERYKSNIQPLGSQLSNIMNLQPVEFDWKSNNKHDIGFVADSVKEVYPNLVSTNAQGEVEGMNYSKLVSALVKSIQEQQIQINTLTTEVEKLKAIN
jgi:hypothetical protein